MFIIDNACMGCFCQNLCYHLKKMTKHTQKLRPLFNGDFIESNPLVKLIF